MGSGPSLELASRLPRLRALVLHSPFLSGLRVMYHVKHSFWFDIFKVRVESSTALFSYSQMIYPEIETKTCMIYTSDFILQNIEKIQLVDCPVLVIHVSVFSHYIINSCFILYKIS